MGKKEQSSGANVFALEKQKGSRFYSVRVMHKGKRRRFSTGETSLKNANLRARRIMADIQSRGFDAAVQIHAKRRTAIPADPSVREFSELYRTACKKFDRPPSAPTRERYIRSLERIAEATGVRKISALTPEKVDEFKTQFLAIAAKKARPESSMKTTLNGVLRNAAALFSEHALQRYREEGVDVQNPFPGKQIRRVELKSYSPLPRELLGRIWEESVLLLTGNPDAEPPEEDLRARDSFDFRLPHRGVYILILLELGLGLRRNEADKAEWNWFIEDPKGHRFIEIRETPFFVPKSKQSRVVPVEDTLWEALTQAKSDEKFVVPGNPPVPLSQIQTRSIVYRCDRAHRGLVAWLRKMGVDDPKPCHRLRKEFGSYISTHYGLFHAQKFLGHSSPQVTSDYYAGLTDLPLISPTKMAKPRENGK